ncbi:hypothetical protein [Sediminihabitans luteus]|uniref:hypothetical protein n=1 Tax=Sediminihabitans luteus TaxID=1138585 RepID=UPI0012FD07DE|nr:hypothetical protein [Sediminihabitans luteus]
MRTKIYNVAPPCDASDGVYAWPKNSADPFTVGKQWLTGTGPAHQDFHAGDPFTVTYGSSAITREFENYLEELTKSGKAGLGREEMNDYRLGGADGPLEFVRDYSTLLTAGKTGNLAYTYLGSHTVRAKVVDVNSDGGAVWQITVENESDIESAAHPPSRWVY